MNPKLKHDTITDADISAHLDNLWKTILFNDDVHTFEDVAMQLVKAIHCNVTTGYDFANQVHTEGSAAVFYGSQIECEKVAGILREIDLNVDITH